MDRSSAKGLVIVLSIVSRLFFGFTPLLVSSKLVKKNSTDSLTSTTVKIIGNVCTSRVIAL